MMRPEEELRRLILGAELDGVHDLSERFADIEARVGDDPAMRESVRRVIIDVLKEAGVEDYERLAATISPVVLASIRQEIRNSRDMMVDALYPITGHLVAAAVRNAFAEMLQRLNDRIDKTVSAERWKVWMQARLTGRSEAEILLQRNPPFDAPEAMIIQRASGLLIAHVLETDEGKGVDTDLAGGMLTAIMAFTRDAFGDDLEGELSAITYGNSRLFIRSSPAVTLAVRTTGLAPPGFERELESDLLELLDRRGPVLRDFDGSLTAADNAMLEEDLRQILQHIGHPNTGEAAPKDRAWKALALIGVVLLALLLWWGYGAWVDHRIKSIEQTAEKTIEARPELVGYPFQVEFDREVDSLNVEGLAPDDRSAAAVVSDLEKALPNVALAPKVTSINTRDPDLDQKISDGLGDLRQQLAHLRQDFADEQQLASVQARRLTPLIAKAEQENSDPRRHLANWAQANVIWFAEGEGFRDPEIAARKLDELARLLLTSAPENVVRVVGFADQLGGNQTNKEVSLQRAEIVRESLIERGVPEKRVIAVGRASEKLLAESIGWRSLNRRVEIELLRVAEVSR